MTQEEEEQIYAEIEKSREVNRRELLRYLPKQKPPKPILPKRVSLVPRWFLAIGICFLVLALAFFVFGVRSAV